MFCNLSRDGSNYTNRKLEREKYEEMWATFLCKMIKSNVSKVLDFVGCYINM